MTPQETAGLVKQILGAYPAQRQRMSDDDVRGMALTYAKGLSDIPVEVAEAAWERVMRTARFIPTIAEIREAAVDVTAGKRKSGGEAWGEVMRLIQLFGKYRTPGVHFEISDPLMRRAVDAFGWPHLTGSENAVADRARFIELYDELARGARVELQVGEANGLSTLPAPTAIRLEGPARLGNILPVGIVDVDGNVKPAPPNHAYLSAGDTPAASGDVAYTGCFLCGRSRKEHEHVPG